MFGFNLFQTSKLKVIPLSPYFYVCTHVNFTRVNKTEAIYGIPYERENSPLNKVCMDGRA